MPFLDQPPTAPIVEPAAAAVAAPAPQEQFSQDALVQALAKAYPGAVLKQVQRPGLPAVYVVELPAQQAQAPAPAVEQPEVIYRLRGNTLLTTPEITYALRGLRSSDGPALARAVAGLYRAKGILTVEATVRGNVIEIVEGTSTVVGKYGEYFPHNEVLEDTDFSNFKAQAARRAARAAEEVLDLRINPRGMSRTGQVEVWAGQAGTVKVEPEGTVAVTNLGPRYSGSTLVTAAIAGVIPSLASEYKINMAKSVTDRDSSGGHYRSVGGALVKPARWGSVGAEASYTQYRTGGAMGDLGILGSTTKLSLLAQHYLAQGLTAEYRLTHFDTTSKLDALGAMDRVSYQTASAALQYGGMAGAFMVKADATVEQGIAGTRSTEVLPLQGAVDSRFTTVIGAVEIARNLGKDSALTFKLGGQVGTDGTPSASQLAIGGPGRASSYAPGLTSAPGGGYASVELAIPSVHFKGLTFQPFVGINGAFAKPVAGPSIGLASREIGVRAVINEKTTAGLTWAAPVSANTSVEHHGSRLNFFVTSRF